MTLGGDISNPELKEEILSKNPELKDLIKIFKRVADENAFDIEILWELYLMAADNMGEHAQDHIRRMTQLDLKQLNEAQELASTNEFKNKTLVELLNPDRNNPVENLASMEAAMRLLRQLSALKKSNPAHEQNTPQPNA